MSIELTGEACLIVKINLNFLDAKQTICVLQKKIFILQLFAGHALSSESYISEPEGNYGTDEKPMKEGMRRRFLTTASVVCELVSDIHPPQKWHVSYSTGSGFRSVKRPVLLRCT